MARPKKCRRICSEPDFDAFVPEGTACSEIVNLTLDEYEAIRLIDFERKTQEQCAELMTVARTSVTDIYEHARYKLADCIINGKTLKIGGGNYVLCDGSASGCRKACRRSLASDMVKADISQKGDKQMRVAVTYENGQIFQHFGHTEQFKIYDIQDGHVAGAQVIGTNGQGHGALAGFLQSGQIDVLICGGIGGGAQAALAEAGIRLYGGVSGDADAAVEAFINGSLEYNPSVQCNHAGHGHGEGQSCHGHEGGHSCSGHGGHGCHN